MTTQFKAFVAILVASFVSQSISALAKNEEVYTRIICEGTAQTPNSTAEGRLQLIFAEKGADRLGRTILKGYELQDGVVYASVLPLLFGGLEKGTIEKTVISTDGTVVYRMSKKGAVKTDLGPIETVVETVVSTSDGRTAKAIVYSDLNTIQTDKMTVHVPTWLYPTCKIEKLSAYEGEGYIVSLEKADVELQKALEELRK